ncbi:ABC transporter ATP-binding protein [Paractinoplanes rishiriensis]|uniref:Multidrug ABC transporter permease n=1 Tax=Paractinoplanes rishiriensis TaxID=1050105 RepID=A0A919N2S7_9ACTN|nr:ATP-binding cassette domain-containing protein [Actinoplanes rishiriensis]GIF01693.1 multidrug ABC transporter permease [Actinoplanes rishiriensis]
MPVLRDRLLLLRGLRAAGTGPVAAWVVLRLGLAVLPAGVALTMALLIDRVEHGQTFLVALVAFAGTVLVGQILDAFFVPLTELVKARIDGAHRAELARLTAAGPTIGELEDPEIQDLVRLATADPHFWTEKTPGQGTEAQVGSMLRWVGATTSAAIVAVYAWWLLPVLVVPALVNRAFEWHRSLWFARTWTAGAREARRFGDWKERVMSPAEGKEQRVYGFGEFAVQRQIASVHVMFGPLWANRGLDRGLAWLRVAVLVLVPLGVTYAVVADGVVDGRIGIALETAVFTAAFAVYAAVGRIQDAVDIEGALPAVKALVKLRTALPVPAAVAPAARVAGEAPPLVELRGVRFHYPGTDRLVLDDLHLTVRPGELLALVGLNGAGKSTLIKILAGLYQPDAGSITADGVDIRKIGPEAWRRQISVVFQDFVRYHLSARDNIRLGQASVPLDEAALRAAIDEAGLGPVLDRLPAGLDTPLARTRTGGVDLSGGQWQQVVLARALYAVHTGSRMLVLDEPTAHLDVRSEADVFGRLAGRAGDTSIVLISHRLSTVRHADRIVLLDGGRITESGSHAELMAGGGEYARMFTIQAERFRRGFDDRVEEDEL